MAKNLHSIGFTVLLLVILIGARPSIEDGGGLSVLERAMEMGAIADEELFLLLPEYAAEEKSGVFGEIFEFYCSSGHCSSGVLFIVGIRHCSSSFFFLQFQSIVKRPWRPGPRSWTSADSGESVAPSVATASVTQSVSVASEASVDASVGLGAGAAPGWGGAPAQGLDDLVVGLLTQLLARFPPVVPQGAPGVPPVAEVQQRAAGCSAAGCGFGGAAYWI
ncbi:unnamed protein product [Microthlaspi erraticum]|uniref:Uncharacterized protein n=1 Tax=Microthlaspi erraticum TaxID=1685480 RepID=A0A6D2JBM2_9BRAS|nr:unnamed protein product [Microthlaspi erraticum]